MALYAVIWGYTNDTDAIDAVRAAHGTYIKKLAAEQSLKEAGAWTDGSGALLVFDVADEAALSAILSDDPYTSAGVVTSQTINEWAPALGRFAE